MKNNEDHLDELQENGDQAHVWKGWLAGICEAAQSPRSRLEKKQHFCTHGTRQGGPQESGIRCGWWDTNKSPRSPKVLP